jgi:hypothetical protein
MRLCCLSRYPLGDDKGIHRTNKYEYLLGGFGDPFDRGPIVATAPATAFTRKA